MSTSTETTNGASSAPPPPPPPPPMPGTAGAIKVTPYKETKEKNDEIKKNEAAKSAIQDSQFANLPDKLMNTMKREKKPFTYTPLSVGDNGKLDLSQIKSPKMKKRLMANMKDEEEQDENKIESIDSSIENHKNQDKLLDRELSSPVLLANQQSPYSLPISDPSFSPSVQTKPSLVVPFSVWNENTNQANQAYQPQSALPPLRQTSLNYDFNRPLSPDEKLDQMLNEQLHRSTITPDLNNNYTPSFYSSPSKPQHYGNVKPKKINIAQELTDERNFNCVPSQRQFNTQSPIQWSSNPSSSYSIPIQIQKDKPQSFSNSQPDYQTNVASSYSPYEQARSQQGSYQIPIINQNSIKAPVPPQRQESLKRTFDEKEIPIQYEEPLQSRSFKILQKLTADIEDEIDKLKVMDQQNKSTYQPDPLEGESSSQYKLPAYYGTLNHIEQPRLRTERRIPIQVDDSNTSSSFSQPEYHSKSEQNWYLNDRLTSSLMNTTPSNSFWSSPIDWTPQIPASRQPQITPPPRYQGSNIPSRTFKILQMLAGEDDW